MKARSQHRCGWSLMELMVVIPLVAILLSTSSVLLAAVLRSQGKLWADIQQQSARTRLAVQLRADAHGATRVKSHSPQGCDFLLESGETIRYEIRESWLHREVLQKEAVVERERAPLNGLSGAFTVDASQERPLVRLSLESVPDGLKYSRLARSAVVEAAVGTHRQSVTGRPQP